MVMLRSSSFLKRTVCELRNSGAVRAAPATISCGAACLDTTDRLDDSRLSVRDVPDGADVDRRLPRNNLWESNSEGYAALNPFQAREVPITNPNRNSSVATRDC